MFFNFRHWLIVTVLAFCSLPIQAGEKYALFIAVARYQHVEMNQPQLKFPEVDAKELAQIFASSGYNVELLLGKQATQSAIIKSLESLKSQGDSEGVVVVGLFGHGVEFEGTGEACFCPFDTGMREVIGEMGQKRFNADKSPMIEPDPKTLIKMGDLLSAVRLSPAGNRLLLADCCRNSPNRARGRAFGTSLKLTDLPLNTAALFACSATEQAFEHPDWGHGAFTKCLIEELRTQSQEGTVTAGVLADRIRPKVKQLVASASSGRNTQTTNSVVRDYVDLQLAVIQPVKLAEARVILGKNSNDEVVLRAHAYLSVDRLKAGSACDIAITIDIPKGMMIGAHSADPLFPTSIGFKSSQSIRLENLTYPKGIPFNFGESVEYPVYKDSVTIYGKLVIPQDVTDLSGELDISVSFSAQTAAAAYPPKKLHLTKEIVLATTNEPIQQINSQIFSRK